MNIFSFFLNRKIKKLLKSQKKEKVLLELKCYNLFKVKKYYTSNIERWVKNKEYDLIEVFLKTGYELNPSVHELFKEACALIYKNEDWLSFLAKHGALDFTKKKTQSDYLDLLGALIFLKNISPSELENIIQVMFANSDKTPEELEYVIKSWNHLVYDNLLPNDFMGYIYPLDEKIQVHLSKENLNNALPTRVLFKPSIKRL